MKEEEKLRLDKGVNEKYINIDPLKESYRESITEAPAVIESLAKHHTALLVIDIQYLDAAPGHGVFAELVTSTPRRYSSSP